MVDTKLQELDIGQEATKVEQELDGIFFWSIPENDTLTI
jgi:hypothetical protein